jgi:hypothetical protein
VRTQPISRLNIIVKELTTYILKELTPGRVSVLTIGSRLISYGDDSGIALASASRQSGSRVSGSDIMRASLNVSLFAFQANNIGKLVLNAALLSLGQVNIIKQDLDTLSLTFGEIRPAFLGSRIVDELDLSSCLMLALNASLKLDFYAGT